MSNENEKWEYKVLTIGSGIFGTKAENIEETLNTLGIEGWEAIAVYTPYGSEKITIVAKRPLTRETIRRRSMPQMN